MNSSVELKVNQVNELVEKMKSSKSVVAFKYQGLSVEKFMQLRRDMRSHGCEVAVIKNNISRRAAKECGYDGFADLIAGPLALIFASEDMVAPAKEIFKFAKDNSMVEVVTGVVDGDVYDYAKLEQLSKLPSYETLLTQLAAGMLGTVSQLAIGLNMLVEQKESSQA